MCIVLSLWRTPMWIKGENQRSPAAFGLLATIRMKLRRVDCSWEVYFFVINHLRQWRTSIGLLSYIGHEKINQKKNLSSVNEHDAISFQLCERVAWRLTCNLQIQHGKTHISRARCRSYFLVVGLLKSAIHGLPVYPTPPFPLPLDRWTSPADSIYRMISHPMPKWHIREQW